MTQEKLGWTKPLERASGSNASPMETTGVIFLIAFLLKRLMEHKKLSPVVHATADAFLAALSDREPLPGAISFAQVEDLID